MPNTRRTHVVGWVFLLGFVLAAQPAWAQVDLSGQWGRNSGSDNIRATGGAGVGDYTGIPFNDAGRLRSDTWNATVLSQRERQAQPHNLQYHSFYPGRRVFFERIVDPLTKRLLGYTACCLFGGAERTIWLDGRPHPSEYAERSWVGFSTGEWHGNILTITTTHLRTGYHERNGAVASVKSVVTEQVIRHEDHITLVQFVEDPAYLEIPMIRTYEYVRDPTVTEDNVQNRFEVIDEVPDWEKGYVPSYALGTEHREWAESLGMPYEASRGGLETLFPEYLPTLRDMVRDYQVSQASGAVDDDRAVR